MYAIWIKLSWIYWGVYMKLFNPVDPSICIITQSLGCAVFPTGLISNEDPDKLLPTLEAGL